MKPAIVDHLPIKYPDPIDKTADRYLKKPMDPTPTSPTVAIPFQYMPPPVEKISFPRTEMSFSRIFWELVLVISLLAIIYQIYCT